MDKININNIKKMTNQKIGYDIYEGEENMKKNKIKHLLIVFTILISLVGGTMTVNAMTDNLVVDTIKDILKLNINGKDYNAHCEKLKNGSIYCKMDK